MSQPLIPPSGPRSPSPGWSLATPITSVSLSAMDVPPPAPHPARARSSAVAAPIRPTRMYSLPLPELGQPRTYAHQDELRDDLGGDGQADVPAAQAVVARADRAREGPLMEGGERHERLVVRVEVPRGRAHAQDDRVVAAAGAGGQRAHPRVVVLHGPVAIEGAVDGGALARQGHVPRLQAEQAHVPGAGRDLLVDLLVVLAEAAGRDVEDLLRLVQVDLLVRVGPARVEEVPRLVGVGVVADRPYPRQRQHRVEPVVLQSHIHISEPTR